MCRILVLGRKHWYFTFHMSNLLYPLWPPATWSCVSPLYVWFWIFHSTGTNYTLVEVPVHLQGSTMLPVALLPALSRTTHCCWWEVGSVRVEMFSRICLCWMLEERCGMRLVIGTSRAWVSPHQQDYHICIVCIARPNQRESGHAKLHIAIKGGRIQSCDSDN